jgi:aminomethyltransferase
MQTPLYDLHLESGGKMVPFAGYAMPLHYAQGILKEHLHTRTHAGLFDVSHMGQIRIVGTDAVAALEALMPIDLVGLKLNRQRYALLTNQSGGILDDLMITNAGDHFFLVVNAAFKKRDLAHLKTHLAGMCMIEELTGHALLALQGPAAAKVMARIAPHATTLNYMAAARLNIAGADCFITRSGYTGEDGFEISVPNSHVHALARRLLVEEEVAPVGLGARDSLRLEAGLCLYGHDIDSVTTPMEAGLSWVISKARRQGGARPGGFPGDEVILNQLAHGPSRQRVGILPEDKVPVRESSELYSRAGKQIGKVTSGGYGATAGRPIAMGYVESAYAQLGTEVAALVRGILRPCRVVQFPFIEHRYYRG